MDMYVQASCVPFSSPKNNLPTRSYANYHPTIWGDHFLKYTNNSHDYCKKSDGGGTGQQFEQLKEEVRKMVVGGCDDEQPAQQLKLIDAIQRLGVAYHFENEIDGVLNNHLLLQVNLHRASFGEGEKTNEDDDLYMVALRFRLLRQQGHRISCDVFNKFKDSEGKFKKSLINDTQGLLSLYEAANVGVREEDILDEALEFTTAHLKQLLLNDSPPSNNSLLASQVVHALDNPIRKGLTRVLTRRYIPIYQQDDSHNTTLLEFAKLDFNLLQKVHQKEAGDITRWWKDLKVAEKLPYARDRVVEVYFWIMGVYFEPQYALARRLLTKVLAMVSIIDDTYDNYGTIEELNLLTDAIERWDIEAVHQLPEYMKQIYRTLLDVYDEMEEELTKQGRSHHVEYAKSSMKQLVRAYNDEAKWCNEGYVPTVEEYMEVAEVTSGHKMIATNSFVVGMPDIVTDESLQWIQANPLIVRASSFICRYTDDIVGHEFEQEREHVVSSIECYMKQHGATKTEAYVEFNKRVSNAWKDMNQECLHPTAVPMTLLERVLNLSRVINLLYKEYDGYINSKTRVKDYITSILVDPVPV